MSDDSPLFFNRKSPRAFFNDYSEGDYFVTICTNRRVHYFGKISDCTMHFTPIGYQMDKELSEISKHYPYAKNLIWTVMPNHIHAIIHIVNNEAPQSRSALSVIIGGFKRSIVLYAKRNNMEFEWQPRYHDHIIRGSFDLNKIARYIETNVTRWESDVFFDLG